MTVKTRAELLADISTYLATNGAGGISAQDLRDRLEDMVASATFPEDPVSGGEGVCNFRLTLQSGTAVSITDQTAKTTLYLTPHRGNAIGLYSGGAWSVLRSAEVSISLATLTNGKPYDVFAYNDSGTVTLELLVWTNDTARATALATQDGILVKSGDATRRYLGTIYASAAGQCEDSLVKRYCWNYYNRVPRPMRATDATNSWAYNTSTIRQANNSAANQLNFVQGVVEDEVTARAIHFVDINNVQPSIPATGIGLDSTTAFATGCLSQLAASSAIGSGSTWYALLAMLDTYVSAAGRHYLAWLERGAGAATNTWAGDNNNPTFQQTGITGAILG